MPVCGNASATFLGFACILWILHKQAKVAHSLKWFFVFIGVNFNFTVEILCL
ncbi:hypothetical LOC302884, isoform CRA_b [Rattus norvegicus]|uniref:Hypothetical LOC302884, isoform CRA_b n=1 Tax=Rattus norvegicus TaxID=10116 RepID=A6HPU3_RAT|nr:hypothetical LOC302884, isoform CRA_b [Rattus norvegicus]EDL80045.1 hypothetical LOC302884, isoform CRA_b [Rattus norvegicus]